MGRASRQMHVELRARNRPAFLPRDVQMIFAQPQLLQLALELRRVHAQIEQRTDEHVAADAAKDVEVERFHE